MHNKAPVVLNCFSRGGSNIFWNIFLTHPDLCSPIYETLEIFQLNWRAPTLEGYKVVWLSRQWHLFDQWHLHTRSPVSVKAKNYIDQTLYTWKLKTLTDVDMRYKVEGEQYSLEEVKNSRLVIKNNNALAYLSDMLLDMYPEVTFFALVRHPIPLYESHKRRMTPVSKSVQHFVHYYRALAGRMLEDAQHIEQYHIIRFEDVLADPIKEAKKLYQMAHLDNDKVTKMRFKAKPHFQPNGSRRTKYVAGRHYWFEFKEVFEILEPNVNLYQTNRLQKSELETLLELTESIRDALGYSGSE